MPHADVTAGIPALAQKAVLFNIFIVCLFISFLSVPVAKNTPPYLIAIAALGSLKPGARRAPSDPG